MTADYDVTGAFNWYSVMQLLWIITLLLMPVEPLSDAEREQLRTGFGAKTTFVDAAFEALLANVDRWPNDGQSAEATPRIDVDVPSADLQPGSLVEIHGVIERMESLPAEFPGVERWLLATGEDGRNVLVLFVSRNPEKDHVRRLKAGDAVVIPARFYKHMTLPAASLHQVYPAFVGAWPRREAPTESPFATLWLGAISTAVGSAIIILIALRMLLKRERQKTGLRNRSPITNLMSDPEGLPLPDQPAAAMRTLAKQAEERQ